MASLFIFSCIGTWYQPQSAWAQSFTGPISKGLGGAGIGALSSTESPLLNPAHLPHLKGYLIGLYSDRNLQNYYGSDSSLGGVVVDNNPEAVIPGALSYIQKTLDYNYAKGVHRDIGFSVGQFVLKNLSVGGTIRYFEERIDGRNDNNLWNATVGVVWTPIEYLGIGAVAYNILDNHSASLQPMLGLGASYSIREIVRVRFDFLYPEKFNNDKKGNYRAGLDFPFPGDFDLRLGLKNEDATKQIFYTGGLGWNGPKLGVDYALVRDAQSTDIAHSFDLRLYF